MSNKGIDPLDRLVLSATPWPEDVEKVAKLRAERIEHKLRELAREWEGKLFMVSAANVARKLNEILKDSNEREVDKK